MYRTYKDVNLRFNPSLTWDNELGTRACEVAKGTEEFGEGFRLEAQMPATGSKLEAQARRVLFRLRDSNQSVRNMNSPRPKYGCNGYFNGKTMKVVCLYMEDDY
ncbi:hypothetical protein COOONC_10300 [Cooperia oncophora]